MNRTYAKSTSTRRAASARRLMPGIIRWTAILLTAATCIGGRGLEPTTHLANYARQSWVMENGLPQNTVQALAQTSDGFLWIGTEVGLVRFDGTGFALFDQHSKPALPGNDIRCLLAGGDGSLWIGTSDGLARLKNGTVTNFTTANGLPGNEILSIKQGKPGVIVATNNGEVGVDESHVQNLHADELPGPAAMSDVTLADGSRARFDKTSVVVAQSNKRLKWTVGKELPGTRIQALFGDREGSLWIGTNGGLVRYTEGSLESFPPTDPLATASVLTLFEDREGDVWAGTESNGLQILRDQRFRTLTTRDGLASDDTTAVVQDGSGAMWVGTSGNGVTALPASDRPARTYTVRDGLISDVILSLAAAPNGDVWVGTPDGLSRIRGKAITSFTSADGLPDDFIRSLLADTDGSLWIGTRRGLAHWSDAKGSAVADLQTYTTANGLGSDLVGAMVRDSAGDLWVATFAGLSRLHGGRITNYTTNDGLSSDIITALLARPGGSLLAGTQNHGWNLWNGDRFGGVTPAGLAQTTIHAILDDGLGHLWFATGSGLARCDCRAGMAAMATADCSHWIEFGTADGLRSRETATNSHPSAWRSRNGLLWFATPKGVVVVDPAHFPINAVPPPIAVERFAVDDVDQPLQRAESLTIPAGHNHLQFDYAALSFVSPQKVRYRFMLDGFDHDWTDAGARRTAYYTNIPPGTYTFRVQAANNDGVWNVQGAALPFKLRPHFYQTVWFYLLLGVAIIAIVLLLLRLRLLRAEREFKAILGERNRIAREIHDTLAQGYVGISVQLEVLSELLRHQKVDAAARHLDSTRGYVREGLDDARQSIWALRSQDANETTLPVRMKRLVDQADGHGLSAKFSLYGAYRPLPPGTEREFLRVAQEAIHNVKKHADATSLMVQLEYTPNEIALEIRDNGRGFSVHPSGENAGQPIASPPGHYGLTGMRERAETMAGTLEISSEPGAGTTVRLRAPARKGTKE